MPFGFLKRRPKPAPAPGPEPAAPRAGQPADAAAPGQPAHVGDAPHGAQPASASHAAAAKPVAGQEVGGSQGPSKAEIEAALLDIRLGVVHPVGFTALTEDWRLQGNMRIRAKVLEALNKREAIEISDVSWGAPDATALTPAPGLKSVDPYDLIVVTGGADGQSPISTEERDAHARGRVAHDVALEVPPVRVTGTIHLARDQTPESLIVRSQEMFIAVLGAEATLNGERLNPAGSDVVLINRYYLRSVTPWERPAPPEPEPGTTTEPGAAPA